MKDIGQLEQLIMLFGNGSQSSFANTIGIKQSTIATWLSRKNFAPERIKAALPQVDGNWLLTGEGNILLTDDDNGNNKTILSTQQNTNHGTQIIGENIENHTFNTEILKQQIASLQALLSEKERLINVLLNSQRRGQ